MARTRGMKRSRLGSRSSVSTSTMFGGRLAFAAAVSDIAAAAGSRFGAGVGGGTAADQQGQARGQGDRNPAGTPGGKSHVHAPQPRVGGRASLITPPGRALKGPTAGLQHIFRLAEVGVGWLAVPTTLLDRGDTGSPTRPGPVGALEPALAWARPGSSERHWSNWLRWPGLPCRVPAIVPGAGRARWARGPVALRLRDDHVPGPGPAGPEDVVHAPVRPGRTRSGRSSSTASTRR